MSKIIDNGGVNVLKLMIDGVSTLDIETTNKCIKLSVLSIDDIKATIVYASQFDMTRHSFGYFTSTLHTNLRKPSLFLSDECIWIRRTPLLPLFDLGFLRKR